MDDKLIPVHFPHRSFILMGERHLLQGQPALNEIFKEPPFLSYKRGKSLKYVFIVRAKIEKEIEKHLRADGVVLAHQHLPHCLSLFIRIQKPDDTLKLAAQFSSHHVVEIQCYNTEKDLVYRPVIALLL